MNIGQTIFCNLKQKYQIQGKKFRICFCPYKEELWDSMQTVFEAAQNDKDTETTIVPLPYFSLKALVPNEVHHEFNDFYRKNFPLRLNEHWDIIVIHNPYDNRNNITRTMIFSNELKKFCDYLVYIPYFCRMNFVSPVHINLPGIFNADLVIVDTEEAKNEYEAELKLHDPHFTEGKIVAWGSPKFDGLDRKTVAPYEWQTKTKDRKVILLQSSIVPYMSDKDKLQKIETIYNRYKNNNDVCLIWRAHPLYEQTVISHRPADLNKFLSIKQAFASSGKDILDTENDYMYSLNLADEIITDATSLIEIFKKTGKPLTIVK